MKYSFSPGSLRTKPVSMGSDCCDFYGKLFELYQYAHYQHLLQRSRSYAVHMAMGELYDFADDFLDNFIEMCFGLHGTEEFSIPTIPSVEPLVYVSDFYQYVQNSRSMFPESFLQNELDTLSAKLMSIKYKLTYVTTAPQ